MSIRFLSSGFEIFGFGLKSQFRIFRIYHKIRFLLRKDTNCKMRGVVLSKVPAIVLLEILRTGLKTSTEIFILNFS
ncbi:hypothetical protein LEP1GSC056_2106 [Leptospira borgpetersenii str. Brem 328]|uniref:Uncharacterized protein n=1 Tax=Leptospira borgpetersenii str. Brem 328 TaxID=1049780 RepID=A0ABC9SNI3_LEPBO|nr:hypothetical protein LEP1GSC056_2106 [Leptospira borgpetersenii str. Brem 328]